MKINRIIKLIVLFSAFIVIFFVFLNKNDAAEIKVINKATKNISDKSSFIGVNWLETPATNNSRKIYHDDNLDKLATALHSINVDSIRYPSGYHVGNFFWDVPEKDVLEALSKPLHGNNPSRYLKYFTPADFLDFYRFIAFCKRNNLKATIQLNTHKYYDKQTKEIYYLKDYKIDSNNKRIWNTGILNNERLNKAADYAAQLVKWVKDNGYSDTVQYWELGNEDYVKDNPYQAYYTGDEYAQVAFSFINKIKKINPDAKILLTNYSIPDINPSKYENSLYKWHFDLLTNKNLQKINNQIYAVTSHIYTYSETDPQNEPESYQNSIYNNQLLDVKNKLQNHENLLSKYGFQNKKIIMNEFNASNFKSKFSAHGLEL